MKRSIIMRIFTNRIILIGAFLTNFVIAVIMWSYLDAHRECSDHQKKFTSYTRSVIEKHGGEQSSDNDTAAQLVEKIVIVIREFEIFENDLADTIKSITEVIPSAKILIICDKTPYPPLQLHKEHSQNVHIINLKPSLFRSPESQSPFNFIDNEHILIFPDATRLSELSQILQMLEMHRQKPKSVIAAQILGEKTQCLTLNINLRYWTVKFEKSLEKFQCSVLEGKHVLLITKSLLQQLGYPFARPFPFSLFIQTALHKIKVEVVKDTFFQKGKQLFTDTHSRWKHDYLEQDRKHMLYEDFGIKKVLLPVSKVEWYGCNKQTARCFGTVLNNMPEYLFEGRWTPPCCLENLRQTTRYVIGILEKCGVRYWLEGGSLLGAVRNGDIIPWDYDVDMGIYRDDIKKCEWLKNSIQQSIIDTQGFVWEKAQEGDFIRVQFSQSNHLHVDIFPFYSKNGTMTKDTWFADHKQDMEFPEHFLKPIQKIKFVGVSASAPNNHRAFLELKFGKGVIENPEYPDPSVLKFSKRN